MSSVPVPSDASAHLVVRPSVLYVGTPAYLVGTQHPDGSPSLAAASSHFALGQLLVLGLEDDGQTLPNILEHGELTVNFPSADLWRQVARVAYLTGRDPIPAEKQPKYRTEPDKFAAASLTPQASDLVAAPRVLECPLQFEAKLRRATPGVDGGYHMVEAEVVRVHADPSIVVPGTDHIDPNVWDPLVYSFRHFFHRGTEVGWLPSSPTAGEPSAI